MTKVPNLRIILNVDIAGWSSWQLVGLITRRSQVRVLPPQPTVTRLSRNRKSCFLSKKLRKSYESSKSNKKSRKLSNFICPFFILKNTIHCTCNRFKLICKEMRINCMCSCYVRMSRPFTYYLRLNTFCYL